MKFEDQDADGIKDATEGGLAGWTIYVDYNGNDSFDAGEPSAVTGAGGTYTITGIKPGSYDVREVSQAGWTCSFPNAGAGDADANGVVTSTDCEHSEVFTSDDDLTNNNFGNWTPATKSGTKYNDLDADGVVGEAGEPGLAGWTIYVDYNGNNTFNAGEPSAVTGATGTYRSRGSSRQLRRP